MIRRVRNESHGQFNDQAREDWIKAIDLHQDRFDALLYRNIEAPEDNDNQDEPVYEEELFTNLDTARQVNTYQDPEVVSVVDTIDEGEAFLTDWDGETNASDAEETLVLRVGAHDVPVGSVLEWREATSTGERTAWWYVLRSQGYGTNNIGSLHYCIPCRDVEKEQLPEHPIEPVENHDE